ncbi:MAG: hypothetical protein ABIW47_14205 [Ginsengibacter sp.]|jgi:hypothetical protein
MKKIDIKLANECIKNYETTMKKFGVDTPAKGFTESVRFNKKDLQEWMENLSKDTTEIKIYFGIYPSLSPNAVQFENQDPAGRFTTILWPCNAKGEPVKNDDGDDELPVNYGDLMP